MSLRQPTWALVLATRVLPVVAIAGACGESGSRSVEGRWQIADAEQLREARLKMLEKETQLAREAVDDLDPPFRPEGGGMDGFVTLGEWFAKSSLASSTPEQRRAWAAVLPRWELVLERGGEAQIEVDGSKAVGTWRMQGDRVLVSPSSPAQSVDVSLQVEGDHLVMEAPEPYGRLRLRRAKEQ